MRRVFAITIMAVAAFVCARAQGRDGVAIERYSMERVGDSLRIDIRFNTSALKIKNREVAVITPAIVKSNERVMLRSCGIYSRMRDIYYNRNEHLAPTSSEDMRYRERRVPEVIDYKISLAYTDWMENSSLVVCRNGYGCCGSELWSSADTLVEQFPRVLFTPKMKYLRPQVEVVKTRTLQGSAYIDFPVSRTEIYPDYHNNTHELHKITGTIDSVKNDSDITIKSVFIKGYASPESPYSNNTRLAKGRTEALKVYVENMYHFGEGFITTDFEPEDWAGLERYVMASSLAHKDAILATIRSDKEPDKKEWIIKSTWNEEYRYLLKNCYPALRHSDYVIEYEVKSYADPAEIKKVLHSAPQNLSLEEFYILAQTYEPGSEEFNELFETAVRMYPNDPVANLNAANSAILRRDYRDALRYLDKVGDLPEAIYARGALEVYMDNNEAAKPYLDEAKELGIAKAEEVLTEIAKNRNIYRMSDKTTNN